MLLQCFFRTNRHTGEYNSSVRLLRPLTSPISIPFLIHHYFSDYAILHPYSGFRTGEYHFCVDRFSRGFWPGPRSSSIRGRPACRLSCYRSFQFETQAVARFGPDQWEVDEAVSSIFCACASERLATTKACLHEFQRPATRLSPSQAVSGSRYVVPALLMASLELM
jgi:hypothetical protein